MIMKKNHRFFAVLFEMEKEYPEFPIPLTITSIKHKRPESINHLILNQIKHLPYGMSKENIIFVVPSNAYVEAFRSIREGLNLINRNHWILGKGFAYFKSALQPLIPHNLWIPICNFFTKIKEIENTCRSYNNEQIKTYLKNYYSEFSE